MRIALVCDDTILQLEPDAFGNLVIGLINEQIDIVQIAPSSVDDLVSDFGKKVCYCKSKFNTLTNINLKRLAFKNSQNAGVADMDIDIVHALHSSVWTGAATLAKNIGASAAFNITSAKDLSRIKRLKRHIDAKRIALMPVTTNLENAAKNKLNSGELIVKVPPGVHINNKTKQQRRPSDPITVVVSGNGILDSHYLNFLKALSTIIANYPQSQFFFDGGQADQYKIWREAKKLNLLSSISLTPDNLAHREILLRADCVIHPQPLGEVKSITLEAIAHGLTIIAQEDQWLDYLIDNQTAWVVNEPTIDNWVSQLLKLVKYPSKASQLGENAKLWIKENGLASVRLAKTIDVYRRLTGESLPFKN